MWVIQSPTEKLDWHENWSDFMGAGDDILSSSWSISPQGPTLSNESLEASTFISTVFVSELELGVSYQLRNTIVTNFGREASREIVIRCDNRQL